MNRSLQILLLATTVGLASAAQAQTYSAPTTTAQMDNVRNNLNKSGDTSVGFKWGDQTGVDFKHWYNQKNSVVLGFAFDRNSTAIGADHLWHYRKGIEAVTGLEDTNNFVPYVGAGLLGVFGDEDTRYFNRNSDSFGLAIRAPLGVEYLPRQLRLGVFAEVAPSFGFVPTTVTFVTANVGARYYF
jgi:hypothetical protein